MKLKNVNNNGLKFQLTNTVLCTDSDLTYQNFNVAYKFLYITL